jgi:hypothetical protein
MHPLRRPAIALGCSHLTSIVLLGPLLGSSADASTAFAAHFADDGNRLRDLLGSSALLVTAAMLVWTAVLARHGTVAHDGSSVRDLSLAAAVVTASTLVAASGLLLTVPLTTSMGELTDDPGIDVGVQAGIAQAVTVVLLVAALCLAVTTVLLARLGRLNAAVPTWISTAAWATAGTLCLGVSVVLLLPFAAWAIALGVVWSVAPSAITDGT